MWCLRIQCYIEVHASARTFFVALVPFLQHCRWGACLHPFYVTLQGCAQCYKYNVCPYWEILMWKMIKKRNPSFLSNIICLLLLCGSVVYPIIRNPTCFSNILYGFSLIRNPAVKIELGLNIIMGTVDFTDLLLTSLLISPLPAHLSCPKLFKL